MHGSALRDGPKHWAVASMSSYTCFCRCLLVKHSKPPDIIVIFLMGWALLMIQATFWGLSFVSVCSELQTWKKINGECIFYLHSRFVLEMSHHRK